MEKLINWISNVIVLYQWMLKYWWRVVIYFHLSKIKNVHALATICWLKTTTIAQYSSRSNTNSFQSQEGNSRYIHMYVYTHLLWNFNQLPYFKIIQTIIKVIILLHNKISNLFNTSNYIIIKYIFNAFFQ